jgi:pyrroloquinoline quinone (PQQ) biosynthesis protein C
MVFLVDILHSELGGGNSAGAHARLFANLLTSAGVPCDVLHAGATLTTTKHFLASLKHLYVRSHLLASIGAQYALEFQADHMLRMLGRGFDQMHLPYESLEFFRIHEDDEQDHIQCMTIVVNRLLDSNADRSRLHAGARECVRLFSEFWCGIAVELGLLEASRA